MARIPLLARPLDLVYFVFFVVSPLCAVQRSLVAELTASLPLARMAYISQTHIVSQPAEN